MNLDKLKLAFAFADEAYGDWRVSKQSKMLLADRNLHVASFGSDVLLWDEQGNIAIRGSDDPLFFGADWRSNFDFEPDEDGVHRGFAKSANRMYSHVVTIATRARGIVRLCGHSRGGAIARVLAGVLVQGGGFTPELYTFGAPPCWTVDADLSVRRARVAERVTEWYTVECGLDMVADLERWPTIGGVQPQGQLIKVRPPAWTWWILGARRVIHHRRPSYCYGIYKLEDKE